MGKNLIKYWQKYWQKYKVFQQKLTKTETKTLTWPWQKMMTKIHFLFLFTFFVSISNYSIPFLFQFLSLWGRGLTSQNKNSIFVKAMLKEAKVFVWILILLFQFLFQFLYSFFFCFFKIVNICNSFLFHLESISRWIILILLINYSEIVENHNIL